MSEVPIGKMMKAKVLKAPVVTAASASSPSGAEKSASLKPTTDCVDRVTTNGHERASKRRTCTARVGGASPETGDAIDESGTARALAHGARAGQRGPTRFAR